MDASLFSLRERFIYKGAIRRHSAKHRQARWLTAVRHGAQYLFADAIRSDERFSDLFRFSGEMAEEPYKSI